MQALVKELSAALRTRRIMLSTAESCTGGMIATAITEIAGSSSLFDRGFVTYSNEAKMEMLGVPAAIINTHGAVSKECAAAMAQGALQNSHADIAVSVTGIAGPDGGSADKPLGTIYIGVAKTGHDTITRHYAFDGTRNDIRKQTCEAALNILLQSLAEQS
ncbi:MAG: CinA family protein [Alphaproteobacteria bacterium]